MTEYPHMPTNAEIYYMARRTARYLASHTRQNHNGDYLEVCEDDKMSVTAIMGGTAVDVRLHRTPEKTQQVYFAQEDTKHNPYRLNPGQWLYHLQNLDEKARAIEERHHNKQHEDNVRLHPERFGDADDTDLFA